MRASLQRLDRTLLLLAPLAACTSPSAPHGIAAAAPAPRAPWDAPSVERATSVRARGQDEPVPFAAWLDRLAEADVVFLGEVHDDETTHRVQLAVLEGLLARRGADVVLAMEMFERDVQPLMDDYLAGRVDEATFLAGARPWGNYRTSYRPLVECAKAAGRPVLASNFPRPLLARVASEGWEAVVASLEGDARRQVPAELFPDSKEYWRRVDNAVRGHLEMMGPVDPDDPRLTSTQSLWDNSMGETCARALRERPGALVVHVNGGFHSAYGQGTAHQLRLRAPRARIATVALVPVTDPAVGDPGDPPAGDYTVFCESRARDVRDGYHAVSVEGELRYRLELPEGASDAAPAPLLVWLGDDGLAAEDGLALWRARLGASCALAAVEPLYREQAADLSEGGRWFFPDTFSEDLGAAVGGIERVVGYLLRRYPLDPGRVCVAGEGDGGTVAAAVGLLTDRLPATFLALRPEDALKLHDVPLPLPGYRDESVWPSKSLTVVATEDGRAFWEKELSSYDDVGLACRLQATSGDPWEREREVEQRVRAALALGGEQAAPATPRRFVRATHESPRGRYWERLLALAEGAAVVPAGAALPADAVEVPTRLVPADFARPGALPRCPGPFGGTTVLVLPAGLPADEVAAWRALEEADPIAATSRFHRLRVASPDVEEKDLASVLTELADARRTNVLIVPARFCADASTIAELRRAAAPVAPRLTLSWRPGLGDRCGSERQEAAPPGSEAPGRRGGAQKRALNTKASCRASRSTSAPSTSMSPAVRPRTSSPTDVSAVSCTRSPALA